MASVRVPPLAFGEAAAKRSHDLAAFLAARRTYRWEAARTVMVDFGDHRFGESGTWSTVAVEGVEARCGQTARRGVNAHPVISATRPRMFRSKLLD